MPWVRQAEQVRVVAGGDRFCLGGRGQRHHHEATTVTESDWAKTAWIVEAQRKQKAKTATESGSRLTKPKARGCNF